MSVWVPTKPNTTLKVAIDTVKQELFTKVWARLGEPAGDWLGPLG